MNFMTAGAVAADFGTKHVFFLIRRCHFRFVARLGGVFGVKIAKLSYHLFIKSENIVICVGSPEDHNVTVASYVNNAK